MSIQKQYRRVERKYQDTILTVLFTAQLVIVSLFVLWSIK